MGYYRRYCGEIPTQLWLDRLREKKRKAMGLPRRVSKNDYHFTYLPKHPHASADGRVRTDRLVVEYIHGPLKYYGSDHPMTEVVHHKDMDRSNYRPDNLQIMRHIDYVRLHASWTGNGYLSALLKELERQL